MTDNKLFNSFSRTQVYATRELNKETFTCEAYNKPSKEIMITRIEFNVMFMPVVELQIQAPQISEFKNIVMKCHAVSNPKPSVYTWFFNNVVQKNTESILEIQNITREFHGLIVKCKVKNSIGEREDNKTLNVFCKRI